MITDERQYRITQAQVQRFQQALDEFDERLRPDVDTRLVIAERDALESQLASLRAELQDYESLRSYASRFFQMRPSNNRRQP